MWTARWLSLGALVCVTGACRDERARLHGTPPNAPTQTSSIPSPYALGPAVALRVVMPFGQVTSNTLFSATAQFVDANGHITNPVPGDITATISGNANVHLGGVVVEAAPTTQVTFDALRVSAAGDNITLHFAIGAIAGDSNAFSVRDSAWTPRTTLAVGAAPAKGSGRMWFADVVTPSTRFGQGYDFGQLRVSIDGGNTLIAVGNTNAIMGLAEDPFDANHLVAQDQNGTVWGSQDSGQTWTLLLPVVDNTAAEFQLATSPMPIILFDPLVQGRLHVLGGLGIDYALHRSEDGGQTWVVELACTYAAIDGQGNLYAVLTDPNTAVAYSGNAGQSWVEINPNIAYPSQNAALEGPKGIVADPQVLGTAYLTVSNVSVGLYVTTNYGKSWQPVPLVSNLDFIDYRNAQHAPGLAACTAAGQTRVYVGSSDSFMVTSADHGATWDYTGYGVSEAGGQFIACDPNDATHVFASGAKAAYESHVGGR